jgi:hypothetical protein
MQKALIQMNLHLHKVISDITGLTGMKIIQAIVAGEQNQLYKLFCPKSDLTQNVFLQSSISLLGLVYALVKKLLVAKLKALKLVRWSIAPPIPFAWQLFPSHIVVPL